MTAGLTLLALSAYSSAPPRRLLAALAGATTLGAGLFASAAPASAKSIHTMHIEEKTSWV